MEKIIITTQEELKALIYEVLEGYFKNKELERKMETSDSLSLDAAATFLTERGYPTSKTRLYRLKAIPFGKYGNRLVFSKKELLEWAEDNTSKSDEY